MKLNVTYDDKYFEYFFGNKKLNLNLVFGDKEEIIRAKI